MSFYVTLPSNVQTQQNDNTIGNYVTILPSTIKLDSTWRVGLSSIHYTNSWLNLRNYNEVRLTKHDNKSVHFSNLNYLPPGRYDSVENLLVKIAELVQKTDEVTKMPQLAYDANARRITQVYGRTKGRHYVAYHFGKELEELLGVTGGYVSQQGLKWAAAANNNDTTKMIEAVRKSLGPAAILKDDDVLQALDTYDITGGIHSLLVYSDVVDYCIVGDVQAQLLRNVEIPIGSKFGDSVVVTYERPYYLPLATKEINTIEIAIRDDAGQLVDFKFGRVEVTLHFTNDG